MHTSKSLGKGRPVLQSNECPPKVEKDLTMMLVNRNSITLPSISAGAVKGEFPEPQSA